MSQCGVHFLSISDLCQLVIKFKLAWEMGNRIASQHNEKFMWVMSVIIKQFTAAEWKSSEDYICLFLPRNLKMCEGKYNRIFSCSLLSFQAGLWRSLRAWGSEIWLRRTTRGIEIWCSKWRYFEILQAGEWEVGWYTRGGESVNDSNRQKHLIISTSGNMRTYLCGDWRISVHNIIIHRGFFRELDRVLWILSEQH